MTSPDTPTDAAVAIPRPWLDLLKSAVRTATPLVVGSLVAWAQTRGVVVPDWISPYLAGVVGGFAYWLIARLAEIKLNPRWGALLLAVGKPVYETAAEALEPNTVPALAELPVGDPPPYTGPWPPVGAP